MVKIILAATALTVLALGALACNDPGVNPSTTNNPSTPPASAAPNGSTGNNGTQAGTN